MRLFILSLFAIGVGLCLIGAVAITKNHMANRAEYQELVDHGQRAKASVVSRERINGWSTSLRGRRHRTVGYFVTYRYDGKAGSHGTISFNAALKGEKQDFNLDFQHLTFRLSVSKALYDAAGRRTPAEVVFLPETPEIVRLVDEDGNFKRRSGIPWICLMLALAALCGLMFHQYRTTGRTI